MTDTIAMPDQTEEVVEGCELVDFMTRRARTYGLLARIFRVEVDGKFLEELRHLKFPTSTGNEHVDYGYRTMYNYLKGTWEDTLLDLARDYARTFIGHGNNGRSAAYPFESVHTSEKRLLMQEARDEIVEVYRESGFAVDASWEDPEDHIALELEYMQMMARRARQALEAGEDECALELLDEQRTFLLRHLLSWTPFLANDMERIAQTDLYQGLALLTRGLLAQDREFLNSVVVSEEQE